MIVLEGPDGSGKTSLAKKLSEDLELPIAQKAISSQATAMTDLKRWVDASLDPGWQRKIYDRHGLISEGIYGPVWNGKLRTPYDDLDWLQVAFARFHHIRPAIIVCMPPVEEVERNIRKDEENAKLYGSFAGSTRGEPLAKEGRADRATKSIGQIYWQYHWLCASDLSIFRYDYTEDPYDLVKLYIQARLSQRREG